MSNNRNTIQRTLVFEAVRALNHPTADDVYDYITSSHPSVSRATVYRNLNLLSDMGEILKIPTPDSAYHYDMVPTQHVHAQCNQCSQVYDLELNFQHLEELKGKISETFGFKVEGQELIFKGICSKCQSH